ncbi:MAG: M56 family metallopeptidase [Lawsonibacter sp.]
MGRVAHRRPALCSTGVIPFLWLAFDKADNDREALCDQRVLERLEGEDRRDYGRVLLSMADSRAVRVPGATTMANGARAIQARIQAIARFKRFPRGMALVSGCMGAALVMALAVGGPAPGGETDPVTVSPQGCGVPGILATAERSRAATVAGALDSYGKTMLHRLHQPALALLCRGMTVPEEDLPQVLEQYREALRLSEEHPEQLLRWWRSGPVFRGLVSDGGGGFLCQVFWFRDQEMQVGDVLTPGRTAPPGRWSTCAIRCISCPTGRPGRWRSLAGDGRVLLRGRACCMTWILHSAGSGHLGGEADGLRLREISAAQILETEDGFLGREAAPCPP